MIGPAAPHRAVEQLMTTSRGSLPEDVLAALQRGSIIDSIKLLRRAGVSSLKDAKALLEAEARRLHAGKSGALPPPAGAGSAPGVFPREATAALRSGNKLEAIRIVRAHMGLGLKEARNVVEAHEQLLAPTLDSLTSRNGLSPGEVPRTADRITLWLIVAAIVAGLAYHFGLRGPG
jgi:ribosomal protein L7/L12